MKLYLFVKHMTNFSANDYMCFLLGNRLQHIIMAHQKKLR
jgi:hypothetical protein